MLPPVLTRRELLTVGLTLGAVGWLGACSDDPVPTVDPQLRADHEALTSALELETALLGLADAVAEPVAQSVLTAHVSALSRTLGVSQGASPVSPSPSTTPGTTASTRTELARQLRTVGGSHLAALPDVTGPVARLLASVGASDLALATALRIGSR